MIIKRKTSKLDQYYTPLVKRLLEEGERKLGPQASLIPRRATSTDPSIPEPLRGVYVPVVVDGKGGMYLFQNLEDDNFYKKDRMGGLFFRKIEPGKLGEELKSIYARETKVQLPSKIAKFCGNISLLLGKPMDAIYRMGQEQLWNMPEIEFFDRKKPWPKIYRLSDGKWQLIDNPNYHDPKA